MGRTIVGAVYRRGLGVWRTATTSIRSHWRAEIQTASGVGSALEHCCAACCAVRWRTERARACVVSFLAGHVPCSGGLAWRFSHMAGRRAVPEPHFAAVLAGRHWLASGRRRAGKCCATEATLSRLDPGSSPTGRARLLAWLLVNTSAPRTPVLCLVRSRPDSAGRARESGFSGLV